MCKVYREGNFIWWAFGYKYTVQKTPTGYSVVDPTGHCTKETETLKDAHLWVIKEVNNHD